MASQTVMRAAPLNDENTKREREREREEL